VAEDELDGLGISYEELGGPPLKVVSNVPAVVGKSVECVPPVM
jgi:hypothetical protein